MSTPADCPFVHNDGTPCNQPVHAGAHTRLPTLVEALALEARHLRPGLRELHIRTVHGISPARYEQLLAGYLATDEAVQLDPILVHSLRARRDLIAKSRADRAFLVSHRKDQQS
jgi:hypothetical protein